MTRDTRDDRSARCTSGTALATTRHTDIHNTYVRTVEKFVLFTGPLNQR